MVDSGTRGGCTVLTRVVSIYVLPYLVLNLTSSLLRKHYHTVGAKCGQNL